MHCVCSCCLDVCCGFRVKLIDSCDIYDLSDISGNNQQGGYVSSVLDLYSLRARDLSGGILPTQPRRPRTDDADDADDAVVSSATAGSGSDSAAGSTIAGGAAAVVEAPVQAAAVALRSRKGWGDRSVNHLLAAVDRARVLEDHRYCRCDCFVPFKPSLCVARRPTLAIFRVVGMYWTVLCVY